MLLEIFHDSFENFEITRICMENHASVTGWQKLFFSNKCFQLSAAVVIATFEIYGWKCSGSLILICSFSLCWQNFSKVNCFHVYRKLITRSSHACKEPLEIERLFYICIPLPDKVNRTNAPLRIFGRFFCTLNLTEE